VDDEGVDGQPEDRVEHVPQPRICLASRIDADTTT
jgi:hypothetical protein